MAEIATKSEVVSRKMTLDSLCCPSVSNRVGVLQKLSPKKTVKPDILDIAEHTEFPGVYMSRSLSTLSAIWNSKDQGRQLISRVGITSGFTIHSHNLHKVVDGVNAGAVQSDNALFRALFTAGWLKEKDGQWQITKQHNKQDMGFAWTGGIKAADHEAVHVLASTDKKSARNNRTELINQSLDKTIAGYALINRLIAYSDQTSLNRNMKASFEYLAQEFKARKIDGQIKFPDLPTPKDAWDVALNVGEILRANEKHAQTSVYLVDVLKHMPVLVVIMDEDKKDGFLFQGIPKDVSTSRQATKFKNWTFTASIDFEDRNGKSVPVLTVDGETKIELGKQLDEYKLETDKEHRALLVRRYVYDPSVQAKK